MLFWRCSKTIFHLSLADNVHMIRWQTFQLDQYILLLYLGHSRSLSLDLYDQYITMEQTGMFRFTPPTHTMLAFRQALAELEQEGGVDGRSKRLVQIINIQ